MDHYRFSTGSETIELPLIPDIRKVYVEPTTDCNFACVTCIRHSWSDNIGAMDEATFGRILADLAELPQANTVHFGGFGEPLTHPRILAMLAAVKAAGRKAEMITNGSRLSEDVARSLIDISLDWLFVSLDGPTAECFGKIRPGADYNAVVENIALLQRLKKEANKIFPRLGVEFVATKANFSSLPAMRRTVDALGADKFIVTNVLPYHASMKDEILYDGDVRLDGFGHESVLLSTKIAPNMKLRTQRSCKFVNDRAVAIACDGGVSPCYAYMHSYRCYILGREKEIIAHRFGNVNDRPLAAIWTDPKFAVFRWTVRNSQYPSCTDCRQVDGCQMALSNEADCWGNQPSCGDCLWARELIACP